MNVPLDPSREQDRHSGRRNVDTSQKTKGIEELESAAHVSREIRSVGKEVVDEECEGKGESPKGRVETSMGGCAVLRQLTKKAGSVKKL